MKKNMYIQPQVRLVQIESEHSSMLLSSGTGPEPAPARQAPAPAAPAVPGHSA